jgi:hypothetical protein
LEIKERRKQIYELYTLPYLRQVEIRISKYIFGTETPRPLGDTSCMVRTLSQDIPVRLRLRFVPYYNGQRLEVELGDLYSGEALWNLNPSQIVFGHFPLPMSADMQPFSFRVEAFWSIIDVLEREHMMLPFSYVWNDPNQDWWFDPRVIGGP